MSEFTNKNPIRKRYSNKVRKPYGIDWGVKPAFTKGRVGVKLTGKFKKEVGPGVFEIGGTIDPTAETGKVRASYSIKW